MAFASVFYEKQFLSLARELPLLEYTKTQRVCVLCDSVIDFFFAPPNPQSIH